MASETKADKVDLVDEIARTADEIRRAKERQPDLNTALEAAKRQVVQAAEAVNANSDHIDALRAKIRKLAGELAG